MAEKTDPTTQTSDEIPTIGVGMIGYAFMGKAHSNALRTLPYMMYPPPAIPRLVAISGRDVAAVSEAARRYGYAKYYTDWRKLVEDPGIQLVINGGPNDTHAGPSIMAAELGKHILCEKPLARTAEEAHTMLEAVKKSGVKHMVAFNYRFVPAVRQIRELIDSGALGRIYHFRAVYLQEWLLPHHNTKRSWRMDKRVAGSGAIGDLGAHIIDLAHYLVGGIKNLAAFTKTFIEEREIPGGKATAKVDVDDAFAAALEFENGAIGTMEATRLGAGRKNFNCFEINGEKGSLRFNLERMNELEVYWVDEEPKFAQGFHNVLVTEDFHPWLKNWWPPGHIIGWEHTFIHEIHHFLNAIVHDEEVGPHGATFDDGYRAAVVSDAIGESQETGRTVSIRY